MQDAARPTSARSTLGAWGYDDQRRPGRAEHPGDQGHRRLADLPRRPLARQGRRASTGDIGNIGFYDVDFEPLPGAPASNPTGHGLTYIDHLTHNVHRGRMNEWADFYERLFNFREIRYFDIEGQVTGVKSKAMTSPCGKIRIPINEEGNEKAGQIQEYLDQYHGEGIQHIALGSTDLLRDGRRAARQRREAARHDRHLLRAGRQAHPGPRRERRRAARSARS